MAINLKGFRTTYVVNKRIDDELIDTTPVKWKVKIEFINAAYKKYILIYFKEELLKLEEKHFDSYFDIDEWCNPSSWTNDKGEIVIVTSFIQYILCSYLYYKEQGLKDPRIIKLK